MTAEPKRRVIVEAPFAADPRTFTEYLGRCVADTVRHGEAAMTSVAVYCLTGALNDLVPEQRRTGIALGLEWYRVADACAVYCDYGISVGMAEGIERAARQGLPVSYRQIGKNREHPGCSLEDLQP